MAQLHPLAKYYNSKENYEILQRAYGNIDIDIDEKQIEKELLKVKSKINKTLDKVFK